MDILDMETAEALPVEPPATETAATPIQPAAACPDETENNANEAEKIRRTIPQSILDYYRSLGLDEQTIQRYYGHRFYAQNTCRQAFTTPLRCQKRVKSR